MTRKIFLTFCVIIPVVLGFVSPANARGDRGTSYGVFHKHHGSCGGVYAAQYRQTHPRYYTVGVKAGRYVWRKRQVRVGTLRRRGRAIPQYRWISKRVLVRPVRYRVRKQRAGHRWVSNPVVVKGRSRWLRRGRC